jgi:hypothetical protein
MTTKTDKRTSKQKGKSTPSRCACESEYMISLFAAQHWRKLQIADDDRYDTVPCNAGEVIGVNVRTPLGLVELHHGGGIGTAWLAITMLGDTKVAVPIFDESDFVCRELDGDPICFGTWWPYSVHREDEPVEGTDLGMVRKGRNTWKLRCLAPDGTAALVPIPCGLIDDVYFDY